MDSALGLHRLKSMIPPTSREYLDVLALEARLLTCLDDERAIGTAETARAEKARVFREAQ